MFFVKGLLFLVIFFIVDRCAGVFFHWLEYKALERSPYGMITEFTMEKVSSDIVVIGASDASHGYVCSILEDSLNVSVNNCGKDGRFFYYQNAMVNGILDKYAPQLILWSVTPSFLSTPSEQDLNVISDLNPWYHSNEFCRETILKKSEFENIKMFSHLYAYNSKLFYYIYRCLARPQALYGGYLPLYGTIRNFKGRNYVYRNDLDTTCVSVLQKTLERCKSQGTDVCFILTPIFSPIEYEHLLQYTKLKHIIEEYNYPFITELYKDTYFQTPIYYSDPEHLNYDGAVAFTKKLAHIIKREQIICSKNQE